jgi:hypothetical protein
MFGRSPSRSGDSRFVRSIHRSIICMTALLSALPVDAGAQRRRRGDDEPTPSAAANIPKGLIPPRRPNIATGNRMVTVIVSDTGISIPDATTEGLTGFRIKGPEATKNGIMVIRVPAGMSEQEATQAAKAGKLDEVQLASIGGPEPYTDSTANADVRVDLRPGRYLIALQPFTVNGKRTARATMTTMLFAVPISKFLISTPPPTHATIKLKDNEIQVSKELGAGATMLRVETVGTQSHELVIRALLPGKTLADASRWMANQNGPAPFKYANGVSRLSPNKVAYIQMRLDKNTSYIFSCELPDRESGQPHSHSGMLKVITTK